MAASSRHRPYLGTLHQVPHVADARGGVVEQQAQLLERRVQGYHVAAGLNEALVAVVDAAADLQRAGGAQGWGGV